MWSRSSRVSTSAAIGGVRLEDTVIVTDDGISHITNPPFPYDLEP